MHSEKSAISLSWMVLLLPTVGSLVISFQVRNSVRPMRLFGHTFDHDYYFELLRKEERDSQSITRCSTTHHRDVRVVPRANRTFSTARSPIPCATSSTCERPASVPWRPWRSSALAAWPGGNTCCAIPGPTLDGLGRTYTTQNSDPSSASGYSYTLTVFNDDAKAETDRFDLTLFDRDGKTFRNTSTMLLGSAVKDVCHAIKTCVIVEVVDTQNLTQSQDTRGDTSGGVVGATINGRCCPLFARRKKDLARLSVASSDPSQQFAAKPSRGDSGEATLLKAP